jgi:hypothetical protein
MASPITGQLPNGFDRADGLNGRVGTPVPEGVGQIQSSAGLNYIPIEELPDSPKVERAEQATIVHQFRMSLYEAGNQIQYYGRGTILTDSAGNVTRVLSASFNPDGTPSGATTPYMIPVIFTIISESISFDTPPDEISCTEVELGINIIQYPRYVYAFSPIVTTDGNWFTNRILNQDVVRCLQNYFENTTSSYRDALIFQLKASLGSPGSLDGNGNIVHALKVNGTLTSDGSTTYSIVPIAGTDLAKNAAIEIIQKYWRNEETPYVVGYEIEWNAYYFRPQYINPGGYVENPIYQATPQLPDYFWSPNDPPDDAGTIFDKLGTYNPQCYSITGLAGGASSISWLRKSDRWILQRTWFKWTRRWIGSPVGFWDPDLFNSNNAPWAPSGGTSYNTASQPQLLKGDISAASIPSFTIT